MTSTVSAREARTHRLFPVINLPSVTSFPSGRRQWLWILDFIRDDSCELSALQQLAPLAAAASDFVFGGADGLLAAPAGFNTHQIAIARRRNEAEHVILLRLQLDEDHPFARPGQVIHLVGATEDRARVMGGGNHDFRAGDLRDADDLDAVGWPCVAPAGARARFDERFETEAQAVAVAPHGKGVHRRGDTFLLRRDVASHSRIQAERADDPLAVAKLEELLHRLAVPRRCGDVDDARGIRRTEVAEEGDARPRAARQHGEDAVALAQPRRR